jgi:PEP-CTERM motif
MRALLAIAVAATLVSSPAQAQFSTYTDRASYQAQLGTMVIDDYSNPNYQFIQSNAAMSAVLGETRYTSTGFPEWNLIPDSFYCAGCNGSFRMDFRNTTVSSGGLGVYGVGFDFFNDVFVPYSAYITFGDGTTTNLELAAASYNDRAFFAVTSDKLVATMDIGFANGQTTQNGSFGQDNLTIGAVGGATVVPEPSTVVLLAAGLAGLGFAGRARRQRA